MTSGPAGIELGEPLAVFRSEAGWLFRTIIVSLTGWLHKTGLPAVQKILAPQAALGQNRAIMPGKHSSSYRPLLILAAGVLAASQSGNLVRLGEAHPVVITAWRLLLASLLLAPAAGGQWRGVLRLSGRMMLLLVLAGVVLAFHFFTWIAAVQQTTVASAAIFFALNPVFTAAGAYIFFRERFSLRLGLAIGTGVAGAAVLGWRDFRLGASYLTGDLLSVLSALLFTVYFMMGKRLRRELHTGAYAAALYGLATLAGLAAALWLQLPLFDYSGRTWLCFALMALVPTLIGHTAFNHSLRYFPAGRIATATLAEPVLAGSVAWLAWGEPLLPGALAGYGLIVASVLLLVTANAEQQTPPE